jgi:putative ABC transport system permease protein
LVCSALLLFKSLARLQQVDIGARIDRVVTMAIDLPWARYPTGHHSAAFYPQLVERVKAIAGVESASISGDVPLEGTGGENLRMPGSDERLLVRFKRADADYFTTMGIPVLAGRGFQPSDRIGAPYVAVINEALARRLASRFGMTDPVGRAVDLPALGFGPDRRAAMTIVGIIGNERVRGDLRIPVDEIAYVPIAQAPRMQVKLSVRTRDAAETIVPAVRAAVDEIDPLLALADVRTLEQIWRRSLSDLTEPVWVIGIFAAVSALLAGIGLYGVVAQGVTQHRREIGIRMALGARTGDVVSLIARQILTMIGGGLVIGLAGAAALTRVMRSLLFEVSALDPDAFIAAAIAMAAIGGIAALVPGFRATHVDPATVLRSE